MDISDKQSDQLSTGEPSEAEPSDAEAICTTDDEQSIKGLSIRTRKGRAILSFDLENEMANVLENLTNPANKNILESLRKKPKTPEERRIHKLEKKRQWYAENREIIRQKAKEQYHNDIAKWQKIRDHAKDAYYRKKEGIEPQKRGRKPKEIDPYAPPRMPKPRGRPPIYKPTNNIGNDFDNDIILKNPIGRPKMVSF